MKIGRIDTAANASAEDAEGQAGSQRNQPITCDACNQSASNSRTAVGTRSKAHPRMSRRDKTHPLKCRNTPPTHCRHNQNLCSKLLGCHRVLRHTYTPHSMSRPYQHIPIRWNRHIHHQRSMQTCRRPYKATLHTNHRMTLPRRKFRQYRHNLLLQSCQCTLACLCPQCSKRLLCRTKLDCNQSHLATCRS